MTTYREAIRTALAVHRAYRAFDAAEYYDSPPVRCATVPAVTYWYGTDGRVHYFDELAGDYVIPDRRTYRALAVLLAVAPIGGRAYLGMPVRTAAAVAALALAIGAGIGAAIPTPTAYGDDGYPALTSAEYADVLDRYEVIRDARTGGRFNEGN